MDFIQEYWPFIVVAIVIALIAIFVLARPRQRVQLTDSAPVRPHMAHTPPPEGRGIPGEAAAAASDVAGEIIGARVHDRLDGQQAGDDFLLLKGVGPKLAEQLRGMGFHSFEQLAGLSPTEVERIEGQLGAFRGRLTRDRVVEQADYLARNDIDGYEARFGKLSS